VKKRISLILLVSILLTFFVVPASATPSANPLFTTGLADDAGYYMEYYNGSEWRDLKTPWHWETSTGDIAYCLNQALDFPTGTQSYTAFSPTAKYSASTLEGIYTILGHGYPNTTGGLPDDMARYATANALRAWLAETECIGYSFMDVSNGLVRAKDGSPWAYDWMIGLLNLARNGSNPLDWSNYEVTTTPSTVEFGELGMRYAATFTINLPTNIILYDIDSGILPAGTEIEGYTGHDGDTLTFTFPEGYTPTTGSISNVFIGKSKLSEDSAFWFQSGNYQPLVCVDFDVTREVIRSPLNLKTVAGGYIQVQKYGKTNATPLSGAVYAIFRESDGVKVDEVTTGSDGRALSKVLPEGTYSLSEMTAPDGYLVDSTLKTGVTVSPYLTTPVNFYNDVPVGVIRIQKTNSNISMGDYSLEGARFTVYNSSNSAVATIVTDENGYGISKELPLGTYTFRETQAPFGFVNNVKLFTANLSYVDQYTPIVYKDFTVGNAPQYGYIFIYKRNANPALGSYSLKGAKFAVKNSEGVTVKTLTTDYSGTAYSTFPLGEYTVQEIQAPFGYVLDDTEYPANLVYNGCLSTYITHEVNVPNAPQYGLITIEKRDIETINVPQGDASLSGTTYQVFDSAGDLAATLKADGTTVTSDPIPLGTYTVKELIAPEGYLLNEEPYSLTIAYDADKFDANDVYLHISDQVIKGQIEINKTAETPLAGQETRLAHPPLAGAIFEIRLASSGKLIDTLITDENGCALSYDLPYGTYTVSETIAPEGYLPCDPFTVSIIEDGEIQSFDIEDTVIRNQVIITKTDSETGGAIPSTETVFKIKALNGDWISMDGQGVFNTDSSGALALPEPLKYGAYELYETNAPTGYWINEDPYVFNVTENDGDPIQVIFENDPVQKRIQITKTDRRDSSRGLSGAVFAIKDAYGKTVDTITTDSQGIATSGLLPMGTYTLVETVAPAGFVLEDTPIPVEVDSSKSDTVFISVANDPIQITLTKADSETGKPLSGAVFAVSGETRSLASYETNNKGEIVLYELPAGDYTFEEVTAPEGYQLSFETYDFTVNADGSVTGTTEIQNPPTSVTLTKYDIVNDIPLEGAEIIVQDESGKIVFADNTDANGEVYLTRLPSGIYTFFESQAPKGYIQTDETKEFTIGRFGGTSGETRLYNEPTILQIFKTKYEDGEPLSGAGFTIKGVLGLTTYTFSVTEDGAYRSDKNGTITEVPVDADGFVEIQALPTGVYWLEETTVPTGYYPSAAQKVAITDENGTENPYTITIPNSIYVKLGHDYRKLVYGIAIGGLTLLGLTAFFIIKRKKDRKQ